MPSSYSVSKKPPLVRELNESTLSDFHTGASVCFFPRRAIQPPASEEEPYHTEMEVKYFTSEYTSKMPPCEKIPTMKCNSTDPSHPRDIYAGSYAAWEGDYLTQVQKIASNAARHPDSEVRNMQFWVASERFGEDFCAGKYDHYRPSRLIRCESPLSFEAAGPGNMKYASGSSHSQSIGSLIFRDRSPSTSSSHGGTGEPRRVDSGIVVSQHGSTSLDKKKSSFVLPEDWEDQLP